MGMLAGCKVEDVRIGMDVELTSEALYLDDEGREVATYKFKPVEHAP